MVFIALFATLILVIVTNAGTYIYYHDRTYPNTMIAGHQLGSVKQSELNQRLAAMPLLPKEVVFEHNGTIIKVAVGARATVAGPGLHDIRVDTALTTNHVMQARHWLPLANLFTGRNPPIQLSSDPNKLKPILSSTLAKIERPAADAKIIRQGSTMSIKPEVTGQTLNTKVTMERLIHALEQGRSTITIATTSTEPKITAKSLAPQLEGIRAQLKTSIRLQYADKTKVFSADEMATWYAEDGPGMVLSDASVGAIQHSIITTASGFGIAVQNLTAATDAIRTAVANQKPLTFTLEARPPGKTYSYCTATRGVSDAELPALATKLQAVFADSRGWNIGGLVRFQPVQAAGPAAGTTGAATACDFTVWLAAADQMPTFGAICDPQWSCRVAANVVINFDRWRYATTAWNIGGGNLEDYRAMVINHEVGHWLGFDHSSCPGAGQPAPVMQQQSINLQGCVFNPWPTAGEQATIRSRLGL